MTGSSARWAIRHLSTYRYTVPVAFATHLLRLTPRLDAARITTRSLQIAPTPLRIDDYTDQYGNTCTRIEFGSAQASELRVESRVELERLAPLKPAWLPSLTPLPWLLPLLP